MIDESVRSSRTIFRRRIVVLAAAFVLFLLVILLRIFALMTVNTDAGAGQAGATVRGTIADRNGRIMAIETSLDSVTAWTPHVDDPQEVAERLEAILDINGSELAAQLSTENRFVTVKRLISLTQSRQIEQLQEQGLLQGITLAPSAGRIYPEQYIGSSVIGYVGTDSHGLGGVEYKLDDLLQSGNRIELTLDVNIQTYAEKVAAAALEEEGADSVVVMVMGARSGELLASVSLPNFDPNTFADFSNEERRNRAISNIYEPGSVFKIFSMSAILDHGSVRADDFFDTRSGYRGRLENYNISDVADYGVISTEEIIVFSSNIGAALASDTIGANELHQTIANFGFGSRSGIELGGEENALFRDVDEWTERTKPTIAIGQEIGVTALQVIRAATAIANDGVLLQPLIIKRIVAPSGEIINENRRTEVRQVISASTAQLMLNIMNAAAVRGTARRVTTDGLAISAKTGTAEVYDVDIDAYSAEHFIPSTLAIFPTEDPQYIVYMIIDYPRNENTYGGRIVAPRVKEVIDYIVSYAGVPNGNVIEYGSSVTLPISGRPGSDTNTPPAAETDSAFVPAVQSGGGNNRRVLQF